MFPLLFCFYFCSFFFLFTNCLTYQCPVSCLEPINFSAVHIRKATVTDTHPYSDACPRHSYSFSETCSNMHSPRSRTPRWSQPMAVAQHAVPHTASQAQVPEALQRQCLDSFLWFTRGLNNQLWRHHFPELLCTHNTYPKGSSLLLHIPTHLPSQASESASPQLGTWITLCFASHLSEN